MALAVVANAAISDAGKAVKRRRRTTRSAKTIKKTLLRKKIAHMSRLSES
jgi:hypothetical protein